MNQMDEERLKALKTALGDGGYASGWGEDIRYLLDVIESLKYEKKETTEALISTSNEEIERLQAEVVRLKEIIAIAHPWIERCPHDGLAQQKQDLLRRVDQALSKDSETRCEHCGWPLKERIEDGCVKGNCSMRPIPKKQDSEGKV